MSTKLDTKLLEKLCCADGVSGYENQVADLIINEIKPYCDELYRDRLGNLIAFKKGAKTPKKRLMFCAHMDEVGFAVTGINDDGTLKFDEVGMMPLVLPSKRVRIGQNRISGVVSSRPVHLMTDRTVPCKKDDLCIDIGTSSRKESEALGVYGNFAAFDSDFCLFGNGFVKAKALDDRVGCAVMCQLIKDGVGFDSYFAFTVGEELGGVGARAAGCHVKPDICIVLEGTTAGDLSGVKGCDRVCEVGGGFVCPFMDGGTMYDAGMYTGIQNTAKTLGIACQTKTKVAGGTDASKLRTVMNGVRVAAISLPCRYIHTSASVAKLSDADAMLLFAQKIYDEYENIIQEDAK